MIGEPPLVRYAFVRRLACVLAELTRKRSNFGRDELFVAAPALSRPSEDVSALQPGRCIIRREQRGRKAGEWRCSNIGNGVSGPFERCGVQGIATEVENVDAPSSVLESGVGNALVGIHSGMHFISCDGAGSGQADHLST